MKYLKLSVFICSLFAYSFANAANDDQTKINLIHKIYKSGNYSQFASPELKSIVKQSDKIIDKANSGGDLDCEIFEHYELGLGNGDMPNNFIKNLKVKSLQGNKVLVSYKDQYNQFKKTFDISCKNGNCQVNNIDNVKAERQKIIRKKSCE